MSRSPPPPPPRTGQADPPPPSACCWDGAELLVTECRGVATSTHRPQQPVACNTLGSGGGQSHCSSAQRPAACVDTSLCCRSGLHTLGKRPQRQGLLGSAEAVLWTALYPPSPPL